MTQPFNTDRVFFVHASNIQTDEIDSFGPFPGEPQLTYEFLRDGNGHHIFSYMEDDQEASWTDQQDDTRRDGWRRCWDDHPSTAGSGGRFGIRHGPFWTDLSIVTTPAEGHTYEPSTYNFLTLNRMQVD